VLPPLSTRRGAGLIILVAAAAFVIGVHAAQLFYPGYDMSRLYISSLGVGPPPSDLVFNGSMVVLGLIGLMATYSLHKCGLDRVAVALLLVASIGCIGVGLVPMRDRPLHDVLALIAFLPGSLFSVRAPRLGIGRTLGRVAAVFGVTAVACLALYVSGNHLGLGLGGMERALAYSMIAGLTVVGIGLARAGD